MATTIVLNADHRILSLAKEIVEFRIAIRNRPKRSFLEMKFGLAVLACLGAGWLGIESVKASSLPPNIRFHPQVIYVGDFVVGSDSIKSDSPLSNLPGHTFLEQEKAKSLSGLMSNAIVNDLINKGISAYRLPAGTPLPKKGLLVNGTFLQINEGNRLRRALIGFGVGQTNVQVIASLSDLADKRGSKTVPNMRNGSSSGKLPGAIIMPLPHAAAAKYFFAGHDLNRDVMHCASKITNEIRTHIDGASDNRYSDYTTTLSKSPPEKG